MLVYFVQNVWWCVAFFQAVSSCLTLALLCVCCCPLAPPTGFISIPHDFNLSDLRSKLPGLLGSGESSITSSSGHTSGSSGSSISGSTTAASSGAGVNGREPAGAGSGRGRSKGPATSAKAHTGGRAVPAAAGVAAMRAAAASLRQPCFRGLRPAAAVAVRARQPVAAGGRQLAGPRLL